MENFIEKLKTVDKKVWIGVGIGVAVLIILIVALVIGSGNNKKPNGDTQGTQGTETEGGVTEVFGTEDVTEVLGTEMATETEMGTETEMTESEPQAGQTVTNSDGTTTTKNDNGTSTIKSNEAGQLDQTVKENGEEVLGVGTKDNPILETPNLNSMSLTTVSIPAGKTMHYGIYRVSGMYLTINDPNAYVIYNGKTYNASNGKVSFKVVSDALASDAVYFEIGNKGSSAAVFTLKFTNPTGSQMNPTKIDNITTAGNSFSVSLEADNTQGHYYKYTAQSTGTIKFYISSFSSKTSGASAGLSVTNNANSVQKTFEGEDVLTDENGNQYILMDVTKGDQLSIIISAVGSGRVRYPAADITWVAQYQ